jgi:hypothetical protein
MPSKDKEIQKAYKDKVITKGQYDKLSDGLLKGIIKKKTASATLSAEGKSPSGRRKPSGVSAPSTRKSARGKK